MTSEIETDAMRPQPGPQTEALECQADVALLGGQAGGGKTWVELVDHARWTHLPKYRGVIFRRTSQQVTTGGGLWDESQDIYGRIPDALPVSHPRHKWSFPSGAEIAFHHLQHEKNKYDHQGGQYSLITFEEVTHFTESQVIYLISRMRTSAAMQPYMRWTCNPDGDSWVYQWVRPFLKDDGITPDPDKCGELKHFTIENGTVKWVDETWEDHDDRGNVIRPLTFTFIPFGVADNEHVEKRYLASLRTQSRAEQDRLLRGLWVTEQGKAMFRHHDIQIVDDGELPSGLRWVRYWDLADTEVPVHDQEPTRKGGPDWTAGAKVSVWYPPEGSPHYDKGAEQPILIVGDVAYVQQEGARKHRTIQRCAKQDGKHTQIGIETEGGATGKETARNYKRNILKGYQVTGDRPTGSKEERAKPWRALAENGRVWFVNGAWNSQVLWWVERFPEHKKDVIDAISGALPLAQKRALRSGRSSRNQGRAVGSFANPFG